MKLIEKILVAIDFLPSCENVVGNAIGLAKAFQSEITLIHVLPDEVGNQKARALLETFSKDQMAQTRARIEQEGIQVDEPILKWGALADIIVHTADELKANLILIGAGEKKDGRKGYLGSNAERIIREADQPVWVVKPGQPLEVKTILCPVEFSSHSKRALKDAIVMARRFKAELIVLNVFNPLTHSSLGLIYNWEDENTRIAEEHIKEFDDFLKGFNLKDLSWRKELKRGKPDEEILKTVQEQNINLLVMGTAGRSGLSKVLIGSVTERVIREVPCTFVTTKSLDVIKLHLEHRIRDIESHYKTAVQLMEDGFLQESIKEFQVCLKINDMHIPSLHGIAKVYDKLEDEKMAENYRQMVREVLQRMTDSKIEAEIRAYYGKHFW
jgi:nucleotide-binding universal stress UspA family protein